MYVQSNDAQHTPRQLKVKSSIKYYKLVAFCILRSADFSFSDNVYVCVKTEKKMTSHYLTVYFKISHLYTVVLSSCTMAFILLYNYFLQETKVTPFKDDGKLLPVLLQQQQ